MELQITRQAIHILKGYGINFQILTKGGMRAARDFDLYGTGDAFASTLTFLVDKDSKTWEPNAPLPDDRIEAIKLAHSKGIKRCRFLSRIQ